MYNYVKEKCGSDGMDCRTWIKKQWGISNLEILDKLAEHGRVREVCKGELIQKSGEVGSYTSFLLCGMFRGYYFDPKGLDVTDCFAFSPGDALVSCVGLGEPSSINIEALEDGEILSFPTSLLIEAIENSTELLHLYNALLKEALRMHWENKIAITNRTAKARYKWFQERFPGLIDRVSHKYVASFLGMTPVSLSRVRRDMRDTM